MMDDVKGTYTYTEFSEYYCDTYKRIHISDDKIYKYTFTDYHNEEKEDKEDEYDYEIDFWSFLTGRIYFAGTYLTVDKDGKLIDPFGKRINKDIVYTKNN